MSFSAYTHDRTLKLSEFMGNKLRGALGRGLYGAPAYEEVFKAERGVSIPQPFVIRVDYPLKRESQGFEFGINLFGSAARYIELVQKTAREMLPGYDVECTLSESAVWTDEHAGTIAAVKELTVNFKTPLVLKNLSEPSFDTFTESLFGRIADVIDNYTDGVFLLPYALLRRKPHVAARYNLRPVNITLEKPPHINGVVGAATYAGDITRYMPYIDLGSQLHAGKLTTHGCGSYTYEMR
jgi:hypothetical protein